MAMPSFTQDGDWEACDPIDLRRDRRATVEWINHSLPELSNQDIGLTPQEKL